MHALCTNTQTTSAVSGHVEYASHCIDYGVENIPQKNNVLPQREPGEKIRRNVGGP